MENYMDRNGELYNWIHCSEKMPECEKTVLIAYCREYLGEKHYTVATALYEDGTMYTEDSRWFWYDHDFEYDEEKDDYIISEGWWEDKHFNQDGEYSNPVDCNVVAWMPLPLYNDDLE